MEGKGNFKWTITFSLNQSFNEIDNWASNALSTLKDNFVLGKSN